MTNKRKIRIDQQDIVGQCLGKYQVVSYNGMRYDMTKGGPRLRHWYYCIDNNGRRKSVQRGQLLHSKAKGGN